MGKPINLFWADSRSKPNACRLIVIAVDPDAVIGACIGLFHDHSHWVMNRMRDVSIRRLTDRDRNAVILAVD